MGGEGSEVAADEVELSECFVVVDVCDFDEVVVGEGGDVVLVGVGEGELGDFAASVQIDCIKVFDHIIEQLCVWLWSDSSLKTNNPPPKRIDQSEWSDFYGWYKLTPIC